jgi:hypothetical protein
MRIVVIDFETYFADDYTLSKMTTESYIRDPRFEVHGAAIKWQHNIPAKWYDEPELRFVLKQEDWSDVLLVAHHAQFDGLILSHHFSVVPRMWGCTLSMARLLLGNHISVSLDSVRSQFGLPAKSTPYNLFKGKHWRDLSADVRQKVAEGACDEVESIWKLFNILGEQFPRDEYEVVDTTIRMFVEPCLRADLPQLGKVWVDEETNKQRRLVDLGVSEDDLQSADRFAELLRNEGIEPARKMGPVSKKTGKSKEGYAFAKNDSFMKELQDHEDERVRTLVEARLGVKSTLVQTRSETIGWMARRGPLCVYLRYAGAHTSRWSGGDSANWQNGVPAINETILPPEGYVAARPDAAQIECRILNFLAGQEDKIEDFRLGRDPYVGVAEAFCGHPVNRVDHPELRQAGKVVELQAGYGSGELKIQATLRNKANIVVSVDEAKRYKSAYRDTHPAVVELWKTAGRMLSRLAGGPPLEWGPTVVKNQRIYLPNGIPLIYETLQFHKPEADEDVKEMERNGYWRLRTRDGWQKMYGAKLVENWVQALARVVISQAMNRITRMKLPLRIVNMRHDDLWLAIKQDGHEQEYLDLCIAEIARTPDWLPGIPLGCEGELGARYAK